MVDTEPSLEGVMYMGWFIPCSVPDVVAAMEIVSWLEKTLARSSLTTEEVQAAVEVSRYFKAEGIKFKG